MALYAKDQTMVLAVEDQWEQEEWYLAVKRLMEEERKDEEHGEGFDEEDDGYCTLPPAAFFKEVRLDFPPLVTCISFKTLFFSFYLHVYTYILKTVTI